MNNSKGEIATFLTFATLIIMGVTTLVSTVFLKSENKLTYKSKAQTPCYTSGADGVPVETPCPITNTEETSAKPIDDNFSGNSGGIISQPLVSNQPNTMTIAEWFSCIKAGDGTCGNRPEPAKTGEGTNHPSTTNTTPSNVGQPACEVCSMINGQANCRQGTVKPCNGIQWEIKGQDIPCIYRNLNSKDITNFSSVETLCLNQINPYQGSQVVDEVIQPNGKAKPDSKPGPVKAAPIRGQTNAVTNNTSQRQNQGSPGSYKYLNENTIEVQIQDTADPNFDDYNPKNAERCQYLPEEKPADPHRYCINLVNIGGQLIQYSNRIVKAIIPLDPKGKEELCFDKSGDNHKKCYQIPGR